MIKLISVLSIVGVLGGCSSSPEYRLGHFTAASSFNVSNLEYDSSSSSSVIGEDCHKINESPNDSRLQRAMDNAIRSGQEKGIAGDLLVNVRIDQVVKRKPGFLMLPTKHNCIVVKGDLVTLRKDN